MRHAYLLETSSSVAITQHQESIMLVMSDEDTKIEGDFAILDQLTDKVTGGWLMVSMQKPQLMIL